MQLTPAYLPVTYKQWVDLNRTIDRDQWPSREEFLDAIGRILGYKYFSFPSVYEVASSPWSRKLPPPNWLDNLVVPGIAGKRKPVPDAGIARKNGLTDADFHGSIYPGSYNYAESRLTHTPVIHYGEGIDGGIASGQYDPKETVEGALADAEHETDYQGRYDKPTMRQLEQLYADDENNKGVIRVWNQTATPNTLLHEQAHAVMQPHLTGMNYQASPETRRDASNFFLNNLRGNGNTRPDPWQDPKLGMTEAMGYNVSNPKQLSQSGYQSLVQQSMDYLRSVGALDVLDKYGQIINQANFHDPGGKPYRQK